MLSGTTPKARRKLSTGLEETCPCGLGLLSRCCGRYVVQGEIAPDAEALMRSRYTAFVLRHDAYLRLTWHPETRPAPDQALTDGETVWLGLEVRRHQSQGDEAIVHFIARYRIAGRGHRIDEVSRFRKLADGDGVVRWYYLDAQP